MISLSPLCPHIVFPYDPSWRDWLQRLPVKPRAVKVFRQEDAWYVKQVHPRIRTVLRIYMPSYDEVIARGRQGGRDFVYSLGDLRWVDYLEFTNEPGISEALNEATLGFVEACALKGVRPIVFNFAVGNPEILDGSWLTDKYLRIIAPAARAALLAGGYLGYHGYGPRDILHQSEWFAFRDVLHLTPLLKPLIHINPRWIHTEAGFDYIPQLGQNAAPWRVLVRRGLAKIEDITAQYERYACACVKHRIPYAFLFNFFAKDAWQDYEHAPDLLGWYERHLATFRP